MTSDASAHASPTAGLLLVLCAAASVALANSSMGAGYIKFWHAHRGGLTLLQWVNDALMAVFFLSIGLELKHELTRGALTQFRRALLPLVAATGGVVVPALLHFSLNAGTPTQTGAGIPMATDIAFALAAISLLGARIPVSLVVFLTAVAVIDDLAAIIAIAAIYTRTISLGYLLAVAAIVMALQTLNRSMRLRSPWAYAAGGILLWYCLMRSGVHPTLAGVLLAFVMPDYPRLIRQLRWPVTWLVLPLFALANTAILISPDWAKLEWAHPGWSANTLGIALGLLLGKPVGIFIFSFVAVRSGLCILSSELRWAHIAGAGVLGGIGFTMSIFIANLAFGDGTPLVDASVLTVLISSLLAGAAGLVWLRIFSR